MLEEGSRKARLKASATLRDVRKAMRIDYFEDRELIDTQEKQYRNEQ